MVVLVVVLVLVVVVLVLVLIVLCQAPAVVICRVAQPQQHACGDLAGVCKHNLKHAQHGKL